MRQNKNVNKSYAQYGLEIIFNLYRHSRKSACEKLFYGNDIELYENELQATQKPY